jgi:glycosyltransferase involved in cell wall biosynthesis
MPKNAARNVLLYFEDNITPTFGYTDLTALAGAFEKVILFSENDLNLAMNLPSNVVCEIRYLDWNLFNPVKTLLLNLPSIFTEWILLLLRGNLKSGTAISALKSLVNNQFKAQSIARILKKYNFKPNKTVAYAFWFYDNGYLAFLKKMFSSMKTVTRAHAGDLYEDGPTLNGKNTLRQFQLKYIDHIVSISENGSKYLKAKYPKYAYKILCIRLGTPDHADINQWNPNKLIIVSCAHVVNRKRIDLIARTLNQCQFPVSWYHLGNENSNLAGRDKAVDAYFAAIRQFVNNKNISFYHPGNITPEQIYNFYRQTPVSLFISVSESEGIPVSMMEAMSYGVPVISTDVGGCSEIVNEKTGLLIPENITESELFKIINGFLESPMNNQEFRNGVKKFWHENYSVSHNYGQLINIIKS